MELAIIGQYRTFPSYGQSVLNIETLNLGDTASQGQLAGGTCQRECADFSIKYVSI